MKTIQPEALKRIQTATIDGSRLAQLFEKMATESNLSGGTSSIFTIDYQQPGDSVDENTLIPQLILVLRHAE